MWNEKFKKYPQSNSWNHKIKRSVMSPDIKIVKNKI